MIRTLILFVPLIFFFRVLTAQVIMPVVPGFSSPDSPPDTGSVYEFISLLNRLEINQDPRLESILKWHVENNRKRDGMEGYRVEIFFSSAMNAKEQALKRKKEFLSKFPYYDVHVIFSAPDFKVRVGDFRTKSEALKLYKTVQKDYPGAFIVPDIIDLPVLKQ